MAVRDEAYRAPLLWLLLPYIGGLLLGAPTFQDDSTSWILISAALALIALVATRTVPGKRGFVLWTTGITAAAAILGAVRISPAKHEPQRWRSLPPRECTLEVEIERVFPPGAKKDTASAIARVRAAPPLLNDLLGARIYVAQVDLPDGEAVLPSHVLRMSGVIESVFLNPLAIGRSRPPATSDSFQRYLISSAVYFKLTRCRFEAEVAEASGWHRARAALGRRFTAILSAGLPENHSATQAYLAMFLGRKDALTDEQKQDYLQTGAMHLFAISGLHIAAIAACMQGLLRLFRMPPLLRASIGILALIAFVEATGGTPSARRALVMVALVWIGASLRRPSNPIASIATAAFAVLVIDPLALWSISFQFSYAVVAMLLLYAAPLTNRWLDRWHPWAHLADAEWRRWQRQIFFGGRRVIIMTSTSWSAGLISTPLTVAYFGLATPGAVLANLVLVPVSLYTILAGFASLLCGLCGLTALSVVFNHAAAMILVAMNAFVSVAAEWPGMYVSGNFAASWVAPSLVGATLLLCLVGYARRWSRLPGGFLLPPAFLISALVLLVTRPVVQEQSSTMKSAYELAMERLRRAEPAAEKPLTPEQKERLAEINRVYQGKFAEREIFLRQRLAEVQGRGELEEAEQIRKQLASERARLEEEREAEKERVRRAS